MEKSKQYLKKGKEPKMNLSSIMAQQKVNNRDKANLITDFYYPELNNEHSRTNDSLELKIRAVNISMSEEPHWFVNGD